MNIESDLAIDTAQTIAAILLAFVVDGEDWFSSNCTQVAHTGKLTTSPDRHGRYPGSLLLQLYANIVDLFIWDCNKA